MNKALSTFLENKITLDLPLKHPEVYCVVYTPEFPRPLTIEIRPSASKSELQNTTDKPALQSPSDAQHSCAPESERTLVFSQPGNDAATKQSAKYGTSFIEPESDSEILAVFSAIKQHKPVTSAGNATRSSC